MKKVGINIIVGSLISIVLIVISLLVIKPNFTHLVNFNDKIYASSDASTFSYDKNVISFSKQDNKIIIDIEFKEEGKPSYDDRVVYVIDSGYTAFATGETQKSFDANITFTESIDENGKKNYSPSIKANDGELEYEEMMICYKYCGLINVKLNNDGMQKVDNDRINVTVQKVLCVILSIFIGFILSFLAYPVILYEKCKENKNLAIISISMTVVLCLFSGFYIFFTLK